MRVRSSDDVAVAVHLFGGRPGRVLLMAHALGLHGRVFARFASHTSAEFSCVAYDARGHGASDEPTGGEAAWSGLAHDALAVVAGLSLRQPYGFGHSAGATALLLAEEEAPGTFAALYCYEPLVVPADPPLGRDRDNWLAASARRSRRTYPSLEAAYAASARRPSFARVQDDVIAAYVEHGFRPVSGGTAVTSRCRAETEAALYETATEHSCFGRLSQVGCPVVLAHGEDSDGFAPSLARLLAERLPRAKIVTLAGLGHLGPLEAPAVVARSLRTMLDR